MNFLGPESDQYEGDKYSGGLAFCFSHTLIPMAIYSPEVDKPFFVYGGTTEAHDNHLLIMASYYDHARLRVPRLTIVSDKLGVIDPHDNPSITIDDDGIIWVFIAGRGRNRPGQIFKATTPYSVDEFEEIISRAQTYSQIWNVPGKGFMHLMTIYTAGRELYMETSEKGDDWTSQPDKDLQKWVTHEITRSYHNYDMGSLYIDGDKWTLIGPAHPGPQPYYTGGEMGIWTSENNGKTWSLKGPVT